MAASLLNHQLSDIMSDNRGAVKDKSDKMSDNLLFPWQCRAARAAIGWDAGTLSEKSGVSRAQISAFENGRSQLQARNAEAIILAFEAAGVMINAAGCICRAEGEP
jgi:DNA-binding XRE family transcriptional regulator